MANDTSPRSSYDGGGTQVLEQWHSHDPRSSSTQSLRSSDSTQDGRRTLLLVYIHGFLGNEMSFQRFPAHVHNHLSILVSETHALHTKIYPRYKSRKSIEYARDDFSRWLEPNETPLTDVILLGHSMGGILAAEVALLAPPSPATKQPFRHRILGTIGFDTPYIGIHPGVIVSGIGSLFCPTPKPPELNPQSQLGSSMRNGPTSPGPISLTSRSTSLEPTLSPPTSELASTSLSPTLSYTSTVSATPTNDPYYDPPFPNDKHLAERKGWRGVLHFIGKHSEDLMKATRQYFMSHLEFGGCLADYPGLQNRYAKIRELEDVDNLLQREDPDHKPPIRRIRFVNYWTASTGIPRQPRVPLGQMMDKDSRLRPIEDETSHMNLSDPGSRSVTPTPSISVEEYSNGLLTRCGVEEIVGPQSSAVKAQMQSLKKYSREHENELGKPPEMQHINSKSIVEDEEPVIKTVDLENPALIESPDEQFQQASAPPLPPLPTMPEKPQPIDLTVYSDKDSRKIAEKQQKCVMKAYQQAVRDREIAIKDRRKLTEKRQKRTRQEQEKRSKEQKQRLKEIEGQVGQATINPPSVDKISKTEKPKTDKQFCLIPSGANGRKDKCWVRLYMEGFDEIGAHCGLFFPGPHYEGLVSGVGARIEEWVKEDAIGRKVVGE